MSRNKFDKEELTKQYTEKFIGINHGMMALRKNLNSQQYDEFNKKMDEVIRLRKKRERISVFIIVAWFILTLVTMLAIPWMPSAGVTTIGAAGSETVGITAIYGMVTRETDKSIIKVETEISGILAHQQSAAKILTDTLVAENIRLQKVLDKQLITSLKDDKKTTK